MESIPAPYHDRPDLPRPDLAGYVVRDCHGRDCGTITTELATASSGAHVVVETRSWFVPQQVLVANSHVTSVDHLRQEVALDIARHDVAAMPVWDPELGIA